MSAVQVAVLGAMTTIAGLIALVGALRPAPPSITQTYTQLHATPSRRHGNAPQVAPSPTTERLNRVLTRMAGRVRDEDLAIVGKTRAQVATSRLGLCLAALFAPTVMSALLTLAGLPIPVVVPAGAGLGLAVAAWYLQEQSLRDDAEKLRTQFLAALTSYLSLVALERQVRGSPVEALEAAARLSDTWPFQMIRTELLRAQVAGQAPWEGLRELGARIGVERLRTLADIVAAASDGAGVFASLMAEARSLRAAELSTAQAKANTVSEQLGQPLALLAMSNIVLAMMPALLRLFLS